MKSAEYNPAAMVRLGEIYEQGFYDVKPDNKKAGSYYSEGVRLLFMLAYHGHPLSIANAGRVTLEGIWVKQDIPYAEQCYRITRNNGYDDPEFWLWENFGLTMRRMSMTDDMKANFSERIKNIPGINSHIRNEVVSTNPRTYIYFVRQKEPAIYIRTERDDRSGYVLIDVAAVNQTVEGVSFQIMNAIKNSSILDHTAITFVGVKNNKGDSDYWGWDGISRIYFTFIGKKDKK